MIFTDRARAEAERRWPTLYEQIHGLGTMPAVDERRLCFYEGHAYALTDPTDAEEWQVAKSLHRQNGSPHGDTDLLPEQYLQAAHAAITAFLTARRGSE